MRALIALILITLSSTSFAQCKAETTKGFTEFFAQFSTNKLFAVSRTLYPTYTLRHEYGIENGKEVSSTIKTPVLQHDDAATPTIAETLHKNGMVSKVKFVDARSAVVEIFKPDTDWLLTYHFVNRKSCWYMHHIEDHSV